MKFERTFRTATRAGLFLATILAATGCESKGPAQRAGENLDRGIQDAKDAVNPPGPVEKAGRGLDKALGK